jgi:hypothetical protein
MTSQKVIEANRRNARRSTGPRTAAGKRKVAGNALRHGLTVSVPDLAMTAAVARMIAAIAGENASPQQVARLQTVAESEVEVLRVRSARIALIELEIASMAGGIRREADAIVRLLPQLMRLERYERRAMTRRNRGLRELRKSWLIGDHKPV